MNRDEEKERLMAATRWIDFKEFYAANWHAIDPNRDGVKEWMKYVVDCDEKTMRLALEYIADNIDYTSRTGPKLPTIKKHYKRIWFETHERVNSGSKCGRCNGELTVIVVEVCDSNGNWLLIPPNANPSPWDVYSIAVAAAPCVCQGGQQVAVRNRWGPHRNERGKIDMDAHTHAQHFVSSCIRLFEDEVKSRKEFSQQKQTHRQRSA